MPPLSPQEFREEVRSHSDIVGLISESVALQPRSGGREYVGLCPFHDDNNPSMRVYPERQTYRCWSCSNGGDCFTFVMEREKVTFPEALEILARRANLHVPKYVGGSTPEEESNKAKLFEVLNWAQGEFQKALLESPEGAAARDYLHQRDVSSEMIQQFKLGFHPNDWTWLLSRLPEQYSPKLLVDARLAGEKDSRKYDNFVNRVLFPIHNERGQTVSFGGRILPGSDDDAKYWNGPESIVFHKSRLLYAIDKAREEIREKEEVLIVEGYTDCIACHQYSVKNTVGTLGTALTDSHVTAIKRFARKVVLVFDGDQAGQDAASRAVERFLAQDVDLRILTLPEKLDPADYLETHGADAFRELAGKAPQAWDYFFKATQKKIGFDSIDSKQRVLDEMLRLLAQVPAMASSVREPLLIANLAQKMSVTEEATRKWLKEIRETGNRRVRVENPAVETESFAAEVQLITSDRLSSEERVECDLLQNVMAAPESFRFVTEAVSKAPLRNRILRGVFGKCVKEYEKNNEVTLHGVLASITDKDVKGLVVWLDEQAAAKDLAYKMSDSGTDDFGCPQLLRQSINALQNREERHNQQNVSNQLSQSTDGPAPLDDATEALLRQAAEFHLKRATKK